MKIGKRSTGKEIAGQQGQVVNQSELAIGKLLRRHRFPSFVYKHLLCSKVGLDFFHRLADRILDLFDCLLHMLNTEPG